MAEDVETTHIETPAWVNAPLKLFPGDPDRFPFGTSHDQRGVELTYRTRDGYWRQNHYDYRGWLCGSRDSTGFWRELTYDAHGNLLTLRRSDGYWQEITRDPQGRELTLRNSQGDWAIYPRDKDGWIIPGLEQAGRGVPPWLSDKAAFGLAASLPKRPMAESFVAAYERWLEVQDSPQFFDWARDQELIGDDDGQFLCFTNWNLRPDPEKTILNYAIIDFEDGSVAFRRNHEIDSKWLCATPENRAPRNDLTVRTEAGEGEHKSTAEVLRDARDAWLNGDFGNLGGILTGDVCLDALESELGDQPSPIPGAHP